MIKLAGLDHIVLRSSDVAKLQRFYHQVLGCPIVREVPELGLVHLQAGEHLIDLVDVAGPLGKTGGLPPRARQGINLDHFCLRVHDWDEDALQAHLAAHDVKIFLGTGKRFGATGYGMSLYIQDPDGNVIELKQA
ncbi:MAG: VOC family virulence protein [Kordiimonas sp.]|nr:VOC family virulence protein [Kordiimonas sp.]|tara:strand:- start:2270 stop:2674 length:405 start_codon:yes stop_codon:yes gene_type:complete